MITAERVIIATGFATPAFKPLAGRFKMRHTYVLATEPIDGRTRARLGLRDLLLWDTARPYHYARWTRDARLLLGGNDRPLVPPARRGQAFASGIARLREYFEDVLPVLQDVEIDYAWDGLFAATPDGLPFIGPHRRYPRHLFALGYGGNGMTFGFLAARLLLEAVRNGQDADHRLFAFNRLRRPTVNQSTQPEKENSRSVVIRQERFTFSLLMGVGPAVTELALQDRLFAVLSPTGHLLPPVGAPFIGGEGWRVRATRHDAIL